MPAKTEKQRRFMAMASTPKGRKKLRCGRKGKLPPVSVAKEFRRK